MIINKALLYRGIVIFFVDFRAVLRQTRNLVTEVLNYLRYRPGRVYHFITGKDVSEGASNSFQFRERGRRKLTS